MSPYFSKRPNGHSHNSDRLHSENASEDLDRTQYKENEVTEARNTQEQETQRLPVGDRMEDDPGEAKTVSYADIGRGRKSGDDMTQRLSEARSDSIRIDPVEVVLSESGYRMHPDEASGMNIQDKRIQNNRREKSGPSGFFPEPVGWLVCIEGPDFGKSYPLKEGRNSVGRSDSGSMDVELNDQEIHRGQPAWIEYREETREFAVSAGEGGQRVWAYVNGELLLTSLVMRKNDVLEVEGTRLMLIPCCDGAFSWRACKTKEKDRKEYEL